jgi:hypothetical protein
MISDGGLLDGPEWRVTYPSIGQKMLDGTIYAGISPDTGKSMYTTPRDERLTHTFNEALERAASLNMRVPSKNELAVLFQNLVAIGGFKGGNGWNPAGDYWSCSEGGSLGAWAQCIHDGSDRIALKDENLSLRLVR